MLVKDRWSRGNSSAVACLMADSCRLGLVGVVVGRSLVTVPAIAEELKTKAFAHVGSSYDEAAVVQTWTAYLLR
jgi:hypothetical protein